MPINFADIIEQINRDANVTGSGYFPLVHSANIDFTVEGIVGADASRYDATTFVSTYGTKYIITASDNWSPPPYGNQFIDGGNASDWFALKANSIVQRGSSSWKTFTDVTNTKSNQGIVVFNKYDNKIYVYSGTEWVQVGSGSLTGAAGEEWSVQFRASNGSLSGSSGLLFDNTSKKLVLGSGVVLQFADGSTQGTARNFFSAEAEINYPVGGFSASGFTGDRLLLATGPANDPFRNYIRYENQWFQTGVVGVVGVTGDFGAVQGKPKNLITARLATNSLTGVASFASQNFKVNSGRVTLSTSSFALASSGLGASGDEDGNLISLYLDLNNVADYDSGKTLGVSDAVFVYDTDESGIIKTKKTTIGKMLYDTDAVFSSSTQNQLQKSKSGLYEEIQYGVVLGSIEPTSLGLIIGASAYQYFTQNTIKSFNGCTGDISITGTANQVIVTGISCSQIVIGLPTSITITGTMNADRFIGRMDGGAF